MKQYVKPAFNFNIYSAEISLSSLNDWLSSEGSAYSDAGITTYIITS